MINKNALNASTYSHIVDFKNIPHHTIEYDVYYLEGIIFDILNSTELIDFGLSKRDSIIEILNVFKNNNDEYKAIKYYKYIGFYWNGKLVLRLINNGNIDDNNVNDDKELHISLHRYHDEKNIYKENKNINKFLVFGASLVVGVIIASSINMYATKQMYNNFSSNLKSISDSLNNIGNKLNFKEISKSLDGISQTINYNSIY